MSLLKSLERNATVCWCPSAQHSSLLASGSVAGTIDDSFQTNSVLEIFSVDLADKSQTCRQRGRIVCKDSFHKLAWGSKGFDNPNGPLPYGLLAGGMSDGSVNIWNAAAILNDERDSLLGHTQRHTGSVLALEFHPLQPNLLASGATDSEVYVWDIKNPRAPVIFKPHNLQQPLHSGINAVAWNKKVGHILASTSAIGETNVWDLRQKRAVLTFREDSQMQVRSTGLAWNPSASVQIAVTYGNTTPEIWDLRQSRAPKAKLKDGHSDYVVGVSWNPHDSNIVLTAGKDCQLVAWNPNNGQLLQNYWTEGELADVEWNPHMRGVAYTCSIDGKVDIRSVHNTGNYVPNWHARPAGASFGFGGQLLSYGVDTSQAPAPQAGQPKQALPPARSKLTISTLVTEQPLIDRALDFQQATEQKDFRGFCERKLQEAQTDDERSVWQFLRILFEDGASQRQLLLKQLGYEAPPPRPSGDDNSDNDNDNEEDAAAAQPAAQPEPQPEVAPVPIPDIPEDGFFDSLAVDELDANDANGSPQAAAAPAADEKKPDKADKDSAEEEEPPKSPKPVDAAETADDAAIRKALIVGDFTSAVERCLSINRLADALVLSSCGDRGLWIKTLDHFFKSHNQPFIRQVASAVVKNDLATMVQQSDLKQWKETLAVLVTYAFGTKFSELATSLAQRLTQAGQMTAACLVYICSNNVAGAAELWSSRSPRSAAKPVSGRAKLLKLQDAIEKISVFAQATGQGQAASPALTHKYCEYATLLASQGQMVAALKYLQAVNSADKPESAILAHRLFYRLSNQEQQFFQVPPTPWAHINVQPHYSSNSNASAAAPGGPAFANRKAFGQPQQLMRPSGGPNRLPNASGPAANGPARFQQPGRFPRPQGQPQPATQPRQQPLRPRPAVTSPQQRVPPQRMPPPQQQTAPPRGLPPQRMPPPQQQQRMPLPQQTAPPRGLPQQRMPPPQQQQRMPPPQQQQRMPPPQQTAPPRGLPQQRMPPPQQQQRMPPPQQQRMPPPQQQRMPPPQQQQRMPPPQQTAPPRGLPQQRMPQQQQQRMPPPQQQARMPPPQQQQQRVPPQQQAPPRGMPQQQARMPPPQQQARMPPPQQQARMPPPQQQARMPPPQQQARMPPPQQQARMPPPQQQQQRVPPQQQAPPRGMPQRSLPAARPGGPQPHQLRPAGVTSPRQQQQQQQQPQQPSPRQAQQPPPRQVQQQQPPRQAPRQVPQQLPPRQVQQPPQQRQQRPPVQPQARPAQIPQARPQQQQQQQQQPPRQPVQQQQPRRQMQPPISVPARAVRQQQQQQQQQAPPQQHAASSTATPQQAPQLSGAGRQCHAKLSACVSALKGKPLSAMETRKLGGVDKKLQLLYSKMAANQLSDDAVQALQALCALIESRQWDQAKKAQIGMVTKFWEGNNVWLPGLKTLITLAAKHP